MATNLIYTAVFRINDFYLQRTGISDFFFDFTLVSTCFRKGVLITYLMLSSCHVRFSLLCHC